MDAEYAERKRTAMDETPPRRSRRPSDKSKSATFPLVPFLIGVVVLGFVIGAGLSMAGHHGQKQVASAPVATLEPTALPAATLAPLATPRPTPAVTDTPDSESSDSESAAPDSPTPAATVAAKPSLKPSAKPSARVALASLPPAEPSAAATALPAPSGTPMPSSAPVRSHAAVVKTALPAMKTVAPAATASASGAPAVVASAAATAAPAVAVAVVDADSEFGRLSASVVKQYLRALERGDTESAAGAFAPGSSNAYPERAILDSSAQIGTISAHGSNDAQTVNVTISTSAGTYFATYAVRRSSTGAAIIVSHSLNKG